MAEHIVEQFENVKLVEIDPNGACFLNVVATFLKISNYHNLSDIGKEGWVYLGLMCLKKMAKDGALVTKMVTFYQKVLTMTNLVYSDAEGYHHVTCSQSEICEMIMGDATGLLDEFKKEKRGSKRNSFVAARLSSLWDDKIAEHFFPIITMLLNIEILVWTLVKHEDEEKFKVLTRFDPNLGNPQKECIASCNILMCETSGRCSHFQLLAITKKDTRKVILIE